jgi:hypothetical protein
MEAISVAKSKVISEVISEVIIILVRIRLIPFINGYVVTFLADFLEYRREDQDLDTIYKAW